jgi:hypothetical protein
MTKITQLGVQLDQPLCGRSEIYSEGIATETLQEFHARLADVYLEHYTGDARKLRTELIRAIGAHFVCSCSFRRWKITDRGDRIDN